MPGKTTFRAQEQSTIPPGIAAAWPANAGPRTVSQNRTGRPARRVGLDPNMPTFPFTAKPKAADLGNASRPGSSAAPADQVPNLDTAGQGAALRAATAGPRRGGR